MLKKVLIIGAALGVSMAITPGISIAAIGQPLSLTKAVLIDDTAHDSADSDSYDNAQSSDDNDVMSNDDERSDDDAISSDATE